jgi:hypothetical protein
MNLRQLVLSVALGSVCCVYAVAQTAPSREQWGEKFNSPGAKLTHKELKRVLVKDRTVVVYNLYATGLPKGEHFILWHLIIGGEPQPGADAYINEDGKVVNVLADPARHIVEDPIDLQVFAAKGEPLRFALISDDGIKVFDRIIPFPIEVASGACRLSLEEMAPYYSAVLIKVIGLAPNEDLTLDQHSENEGGQTKAKADETGSYSSLVMPFVKSKTSGTASFQVTANSCKVGLSFPWGQGSQKYQ